MLGPLWLTLSTGILVGALGYLYAGIFHTDIRTYLPFLALSMVLWGFLASVLRLYDDLTDDPASAIEHAVSELLPAAFHDTEAWWQLSSSAGFSAGMLKVHVFFWLYTPADNPAYQSGVEAARTGR